MTQLATLMDLRLTHPSLLQRKLAGGETLEAALNRLAQASGNPLAQLKAKGKSWPLGWLEAPYGGTWVEECVLIARKLREDCAELIVCGIGGSALGAQAVYEALDWPVEFLLPVHFLDNSDPTQIARLCESLDLTDCAVNIISKSGETLETMAGFIHLLSLLERSGLTEDAIAGRIVATTDPVHGILRPLAVSRGWATLPVPPDVGGRFSVFTPVGLLPLAYAGVDLEALLSGARLCMEEIAALPCEQNPAWQLAATLYLLHTQGAVGEFVQYIYGDPLLMLGDFFRQLWAESLAKSLTADGQPRDGACLAPVVARGTTDQHSQNQLYMEGANDKAYCFLSCEKWEDDPRIEMPTSAGLDAFRFLDGRRFSEVLEASRVGTRDALGEAGRPLFEFVFPRLSAPVIGAYLQLWMLATAFAGMLYGVNPFDQPGVERSKLLTRKMLSRSAGVEQK